LKLEQDQPFYLLFVQGVHHLQQCAYKQAQRFPLLISFFYEKKNADSVFHISSLFFKKSQFPLPQWNNFNFLKRLSDKRFRKIR